MDAVKQILSAFDAGHAGLLLSGRSLRDLVTDRDGKLRPLLETLRRVLRERGILLITYSLAAGLDWDRERIADERDRRTIETALSAHGLTGITQDQHEPARIIRGVSSLCRAPAQGLAWADNTEMRFAFLVEFAEHLMPGTLVNGSQADHQTITIELAHLTAQSLALRTSGNLVIFHGRDGLIDELVTGALHRVRLQQPGAAEKRTFLDAACALYAQASFEAGLDLDAVAKLTANTPNRGLEELLRASHRAQQPVTAKELTAQKNRDVEHVSEGTLTALDTARVKDVKLCGLNIVAARRVLNRCAEGLLAGDPNTPLNILLVGPMGTGKTDLALETAHLGKVSAYQLHTPKGGIVGETERKTRLQWQALNAWGGVAFVDEITESLPLERSDFDGDSGASRAVTAALLTELSNEAMRGKRLLIATTNCPWRMSAAMRSRFLALPVLHPLKADFPAIIVATAARVLPGVQMPTNDPQIKAAAEIFYTKGASPRHIRAQLSNALLLFGKLSPKVVFTAARDLRTGVDEVARIYAELWAIKACTSGIFFPWRDNPTAYPYPEHLQGIVDPATGEVDEAELNKRIAELKPYANV